MGSSSPSNEQRPDDYRRKWDREEYGKLARGRLEEGDLDLDWKSKDKQPPVRCEFLKPRDYRVDLESKLGKTIVITKTPTSQTGGYCNVCDCVIKDSINFLDHINGKNVYQRNLGMSMQVERSTHDQVKQRMEMNKRKGKEKQREYDFEQRLKELKDEEEKLKEYRREKRKEKNRKAADNFDVDPDMAAIMRFSGFCSSKK